MRLLKFILILLFFYALMKVPGLLFGKPIPGSLISVYLFFIAVTVLLVMTATDEGAEKLLSPIRSLLEDPSKRLARGVLFAVLPAAAGLLVYCSSAPSGAPPAELRSVHPAPPARMRAYGKVFDLGTLENPLRKAAKEDPAAFSAFIKEGGDIYFRNCVFCHGAKLDGRGHYAHALDPLPLPFTGSDTIAQLQESYVFWRVVKGGPGLPREGGPAASAMPAWEDKLSEEEAWKVILFIYSYTGNSPRAWR